MYYVHYHSMISRISIAVKRASLGVKLSEELSTGSNLFSFAFAFFFQFCSWVGEGRRISSDFMNAVLLTDFHKLRPYSMEKRRERLLLEGFMSEARLLAVQFFV